MRPAALLLAAALEATIAEMRFYRHDTARPMPGDGLGLSVAATIAELRGMAYAAEDNAPGLRIMFDLQN